MAHVDHLPVTWFVRSTPSPIDFRSAEPQFSQESMRYNDRALSTSCLSRAGASGVNRPGIRNRGYSSTSSSRCPTSNTSSRILKRRTWREKSKGLDMTSASEWWSKSPSRHRSYHRTCVLVIQTRYSDGARPNTKANVTDSSTLQGPEDDSSLMPQLDFCNKAGTVLPATIITNPQLCIERQSAPFVEPKPKEQIIRSVISFSTRLIRAMWFPSATTPQVSSVLTTTGVQVLKDFVVDVLRGSSLTYSTLQIALFYLVLIKPYVKQEQGVSLCCAVRYAESMLLTALILASKYHQDNSYSSRAWSQISGVPIAEINANERYFLGLIQFDLHLRKEVFENWSKITLTLGKINEANTIGSIPVVAYFDPTGFDCWWFRQLCHLTPELVQDSKLTNDYLTSLRISNIPSDILAKRSNKSRNCR